MAEYGTIGVAEYGEAIAKMMRSGTLYQIGVRNVAVSGKADSESEYLCTECFVGNAVLG